MAMGGFGEEILAKPGVLMPVLVASIAGKANDRCNSFLPLMCIVIFLSLGCVFTFGLSAHQVQGAFHMSPREDKAQVK